jgi:hypothetical protein
MNLDLSRDDVIVLEHTLLRHIQMLQDELAHTESFELQRALHSDIDSLEKMLSKLRNPATKWEQPGR